MKKCTLILFLVISINLLGQETKNDSKKTVKYSIDSEVTIIYKDSLLSLSEEKSPIYLVDGIQVNNTKGLKYLNPENIKSVNVDKEKFTDIANTINILVYHDIITKVTPDLVDLLVGKVKMRSFFDVPLIEIKQIKSIYYGIIEYFES